MGSAKAKPGSEVSSKRKARSIQRSAATRGYVGKSATLLAICILLTFASPLARGAQKSGSKAEFLVARHQIQDPFFRQSVVLMLPSVKSPLIVGLIVNKPTRMTVGKLFPQSPEFSSRTEAAYFGGPVSVGVASLLFQSPTAPEHALRVFGNVYLTFDPNLITSTFRNSKPNSRLRLFLGRSQWGPNQLQKEMHEGAWDKVEAQGNLIFTIGPQNLWRILHNQAAPSKYIKYRIPASGSTSSSKKAATM